MNTTPDSLPLGQEIRDRLSSYLVGGTTLADFEAWFVPATWNVEKLDAPLAVRLTYDVEHLLAEYSAGAWTDHQLRGLLRATL